MKKKRRLKKTVLIIIVVLAIAGISLSLFYFFKVKKEEEAKRQLKEEREKLVEKINKHFAEVAKIDKDTALYEKKDNEYLKIGEITKDEIVNLEKENITYKTKYFLIKDLNLYISYEDVSKSENNKVVDLRYKNYLPYNLNINSKDEVHLYRDGKLVYKINKKIETPIIRREDNGYYIEYLGELLYIPKEDVLEVVDANNTDKEEASSVPVTCYHFIYLEGDTSCNESICHHENQIKEEFQYLKDNNYFTLTTTELRLFIEDKIRLPKNSILITIDDGARAENFIPLLESYKINATLFLISSWYPTEKFASSYMEIASHTHNLHTPGVCPGGQGSPLKCADKNELLNDLRQSRETLNGTEALCFPFYEFNDYAIDVVREAGFKMAFIGGMRKATKGIDLYKIPRLSIHSDTSLNTYISYVS